MVQDEIGIERGPLKMKKFLGVVLCLIFIFTRGRRKLTSHFVVHKERRIHLFVRLL